MGKTFPVPLKIFYLAAPYRGKTINETRVNIRYAESVAAKLWAQGYDDENEQAVPFRIPKEVA